MNNKCHIVQVGLQRNGNKRYWCLEHGADATAEHGTQADQCRNADIRPIMPEETCALNIADYPGGVGLWGAVAPVYDTTLFPIQTGVHVHARKASGGPKQIDDTFREVSLTYGDTPGHHAVISEWEAVYFMVASVLGLKTKQVDCRWCGYPHLDKDWFSVHLHRSHLCAGCGRTFRDTEYGISNPIAKLDELPDGQERQLVQAHRVKTFSQSDYPGGIQLWGSNRAILWTSSIAQEEGVHLHAFDQNNKIVVDDTFSELIVDGLNLAPDIVRAYMAQSALPHLSGRVVNLHCPNCQLGHFDRAENSFTPHTHHICDRCGENFRSVGRLRKTIGNPIVGILLRLGDTAPRAPQTLGSANTR